MDRSVSINKSRLLSDTVGFLCKTLYKYLKGIEFFQLKKFNRITYFKLSKECGFRGLVCPNKPFFIRLTTDIRMTIYN